MRENQFLLCKMANQVTKSFVVSASDCLKIIKQFPDDENDELEFYTNTDVNTGNTEIAAFGGYFCKRISEAFGIKVAIGRGLR